MNGPHTIDTLLSEVVTLPSLPEAVARFRDLVNDPGSSLREIGQAVSADPAISLKTLRLVNSAYYGFTHKVTSVEHAASLLGLKVMKNLVFTATFLDTFQDSSETLMRHSVLCGAAMRAITRHVDEENGITEDEAFVFGLLHDVGKILLSEFLTTEYEAAVEASRKERVPQWKTELALIGVDHAELGAQLALNWGVSPLLVAGIAGHHNLARCEDDPEFRVLAAQVAVANYISATSGIPAVTGVPTVADDEMWETAGLTSADMPHVINAFFDTCHKAGELIHIAV